MGHRGLRDVINGAGVSAAACMADWAVRMRFLEPSGRRRSGEDQQGGGLAGTGAEIRAEATAEMDPACQAAHMGPEGGQLELAGVKRGQAAASSICRPSQSAAQSFPCRIFTREAAFCLLCSRGKIDDFSQIPKSCSATFPKQPSHFFPLIEKILQLPLAESLKKYNS